MKRNRKQILKSIAAAFLCVLMVLQVMAEPMVVYAASYTVTFDPNGGTYSGSTSSTTKTVSSGSTVTFDGNPTRTGYTFNGWNLSAQTIKSYADGSGGSISHTVGKWTSGPTKTTSDGYTKYKGTVGTNSSSDNWIILLFPTYSVYEGETITVSGDWRINSCPVEIWIAHFWYYGDWSGQMSSYSQSSSWRTFSFSRTTSQDYTTAYLDFTTESLSGVSNFTYDVDFKNIKIQRSATNYTGSSFVCYDGDMTATAQWVPNTYTITLDNQNATTTGTTAYYEKYATGNYSNSACTPTYAISSITIPTKTGYTFGGYYTGTGGTGTQYIDANGSISSTNTTFTANTTLYAKWTANTYTISYNANGGSTTATAQTVAYNSAVDLTPVATKTGYTFIGWSTDSSARAPLASYSMPAGNFTLYAVYSINVSDVENHTYPSYSATSKADDEVYLLVYETGNETNCKYYPLTYTKDANTMVYTYSLSATTVSLNVSSYTYQVVARDNAGNYKVLASGTVTSAGAVPDGKDAIIEEIPEEILPVYYTQTVKHYRNDPALETPVWFETVTTDVLEGQAFTPSYVTAPSGYSTSSKDSGGKVTSEKTYNAYYKPNSYTLTFNTNATGVTCDTATKTVTYDYFYGDFPTPVRTGYDFAGWNTKADGTGTYPSSGDIYKTAGNQTLYAQWTPKVLNITLDSQDATTTGTTIYYEKYATGNYSNSACTTAISKITVPTKTGYIFGGYYTEKAGTGTRRVTAAGVLPGNTTFTADTTLYAKWTPITYTIIYNANGGSGTMASTSATYDTPCALSTGTFTRTGYTFKGWATSANGGVVYEDKDVVKNLTSENGKPISLYAVWDINSYVVYYDYQTNGGKGASKISGSRNYGEKVDLSVTAEKPEYDFVGWNTDPTATTALDSLIMGTQPVTLYAIYGKTIRVTLTEMTNDGIKKTTLSERVYNNVSQATFHIATKGVWDEWDSIGWTEETGADASPMLANGAFLNAEGSKELYALYTSDIILNYDTNGSTVKYDSVNLPCYYNAAGNYQFPQVQLAQAPFLQDYAFVNWSVGNGSLRNDRGIEVKESDAGAYVTVMEDTSVFATWDGYPVIEAYHRYFTLEQAQSGDITPEVLLSKVTATDQEDGILQNGSAVRVKDFQIKEGQNSVTYEATDSFGNVVTKTVKLFVTDTSLQEKKQKCYIRFISGDYLVDETGNPKAPTTGGLEETSIWRQNETYWNLLLQVLLNPSGYEEIHYLSYEEIKDLYFFVE